MAASTELKLRSLSLESFCPFLFQKVQATVIPELPSGNRNKLYFTGALQPLLWPFISASISFSASCATYPAFFTPTPQLSTSKITQLTTVESLYASTAVSQLRFCSVPCALFCTKRELPLGTTSKRKICPHKYSEVIQSVLTWCPIFWE